MVKKISPFLVSLAVSIFATWGFLTSGFVPTHDAEYHIIRLWQFDKMIASGELFPRWAPDLNFSLGVPLFNFFYPLPNYIGEAFHLLGFSLIDSVKLTLAAGMIASAVFFYLWTKSLFGVWAGMVGAIFYTLAPYHLLDLYVRGTPGEIWALALLPAVLWAVERERTVLAGFFLALLILSHNILVALFLPFLLSYLIFLGLKSKAKKYFIINTLYLILLGFSLSAFFWVPAVLEAKYVTGLSFINFADHFPALFQLIFPSWGTGFSIPGILDEMSFQIGIPHLLVIILSLFFLRKNPYLPFFFLWFGIILFFLLEVSLPVWRLIPGLSLIQYPWRLLSLVILLTSFMASFLVFLKRSKVFLGFLIFLLILFYGGYTQPVKYPPREDGFYLNNPDWIEGTATLANSFSTIWLKPGQVRAEKKLEIVSGQAEFKKENLRPQVYHFQVEAATPAEVKVNTAYFPGWKVWLNGKEIPVDLNKGLINFKIPPGESRVEVKFTNTPIRSLANSISFASLFFIGILGIVKRVKPWGGK